MGPLLLVGDASQKKIVLAFRLHSGRMLDNPTCFVLFYFC